MSGLAQDVQAEQAHPVCAGFAAPPDLRERAIDGGGALVDAAVLAEADAGWYLPGAASPVSSGGRQAAWYVDGTYGQAVLRHYRRGGLAARISKDLYLWQGAQHTRSFAELRLLAALYAQGLPVPRPLAAAWWRVGGCFYRAAILTQRIPQVSTLAQSLDRADPVATAAVIRAMHNAGVWHADLNAHNLLVDARGRVWLIDFDRGRRISGPLPDTGRRENLLRLRRSLEKVAQADGQAWWDALWVAYQDPGAFRGG